MPYEITEEKLSWFIPCAADSLLLKDIHIRMNHLIQNKRNTAHIYMYERHVHTDMVQFSSLFIPRIQCINSDLVLSYISLHQQSK